MQQDISFINITFRENYCVLEYSDYKRKYISKIIIIEQFTKSKHAQLRAVKQYK